jgi:[amino group carrier protein]-L-2-aminoadipate 6-kinase
MIVVKAGGSKGTDLAAVCADVAGLVHGGERVVLVHGSSHETNVLSDRLGHPARFVTSTSGHTSRYTDRTTIEIVTMVSAGKINKLIVERLQGLGVNAIGLSGLDGRLLEATRKESLRIVENGKQKVLRGEYSGRIDAVNAGLLRTLLGAGYVPVVAPLALSHQNETVNVDGDRAAAAIAAALGAATVIILSNVPGLLRDPCDETTLVTHVEHAHVESYVERYARGAMKRKLLGATEALRDGVGRVVIADGRAAHPLQAALAGQGTVIE